MDKLELNWDYGLEKEQQIKYFLHNEGLPRNFIKAVKFSGGEIQLNGKPVNVRAVLTKGDHLKVIAPEERGHNTVAPSHIPIDIVYEDRDYLIINKPSDAVSIPSIKHPDSSMANRIRGYYERQGYGDQVIHIVTRLDRDTTGLMLIAKHRLAHAYMDRIILERGLEKIYYAISHKTDWADHGLIEGPIARDPESIIRRIVDENGQKALTEYWLMESGQDTSLLRLKLHTGRTHQIRVHLSSQGGPLLGDDLYGGRPNEIIQRQALHCGELNFIHPFSQEQIQIRLPLPEDMDQWINSKKRSE